MQRKIIHAFFAGPSPGDLDRTTGVIYAVCNDGSFWRSVPGKFTTWEREANIPDGLRQAVAVAAGENYSLALKADGTVFAWGDYYEGASEGAD